MSEYDPVRELALEIAYKKASEDPELQEAIKRNLFDRVKDEVYQLYLARRKAEFESLKELYGGSGSSLRPGYQYSYSGADATAWVYYPGKSQQLLKQREELLTKLQEAEAKMKTRINPLDSDSGLDQGYYEEQANSIRDRINGLDKVTDAGWVKLDSLATISLSIHEPRSFVRALGHKAPKGFAGSVRTIAGSMIFTIVEDHPLRSLFLIDDEVNSKPSNRAPWSVDHYLKGRGTPTKHDNITKLATMLTPFNMHIRYLSEYLNTDLNQALGAAISIEGIQIISESIVTSVNDIVTEITYQFIAQDVKEFTGDLYNAVTDARPVPDLTKENTEQILEYLGATYDDFKTSTAFSSQYEESVLAVMSVELSQHTEPQ